MHEVAVDLVKLCAFFCQNIYGVEKIIDEDDDEMITEHTVTDSHAGSQRTYSLKRYVFHATDHPELCCLYTAVYVNPLTDYTEKYAFLVWKGTWSEPQAVADFQNRHLQQENHESYRKYLVSLCDNFLIKLKPFLDEMNINATEYKWYVTGHSLGGSLATMTNAYLKTHPKLLPGVEIDKVVTFGSMKLPIPLISNDGDFAHKNHNVIEYYSSYDWIPNKFPLTASSEDKSLNDHIGYERIDVGYFTNWKNLFSINVYQNVYFIPIPHSMTNFVHYVETL
jgi:hypothetical protein